MIRGLGEARNLIEVVQLHAAQQPEGTAFVFLVDGEDREQRISYAELDRQSRAFASALLQTASPGERALLLYPSGLEFIVAFLGCLYAGIVAVPTIVPHLKRATPRLKVLLEDAGATVACTQAELHQKFGLLADEFPEFNQLKWMVSEHIAPGADSGWAPVEISPDSLAFLQYTSGSTRTPRGTMISHDNLLQTILDGFIQSDFDAGSSFVSWMPIFHDFGLIYGLLTPLYAGVTARFMSPVAFLERPYRWLRAISRHGATHTAAPNFAYELCTRNVLEEEKSTLDLSNLKVAANAAEPVRLETMLAFAEAFKACGFGYDTFCPSYGLAEATVAVTAKASGQQVSHCTPDPEKLHDNKVVILPENDPRGYKSVGCGWSAIGADIRIVNPTTRIPCAPDEVGEIWVSSRTVAQGYWGHPEETEHTFRASLADSGEGPFLRTGDMGFIYQGQLHVAGRIKDMVLIKGRNFYPQDIELTVEKSHPALQPGATAAFSIDGGDSERLVVVQEVRRAFRKSDDFEGIANTVRLAVAKNHGLRADAVILIMPGTIHKTTSGKIQRGATRQAFTEDALSVLYQWRAPR